MTAYTVDLGFSLLADTIATTPYLPLQNAPIRDEDQAPAWYTQFLNGDRLSFVINNITELGGIYEYSQLELESLELKFTDPDTEQAKYPFTSTPPGISLHDGAVFLPGDRLQQREPEESPVYSAVTGLKFPRWSVAPTVENPGGFFFEFGAVDGDFATFEMSAALSVQVDGDRKLYVFDPELIVGSGS